MQVKNPSGSLLFCSFNQDYCKQKEIYFTSLNFSVSDFGSVFLCWDNVGFPHL